MSNSAAGAGLYGVDADDDDDARETLRHHKMQTVLLHAIHKKLTEQTVPFRVQIPGRGASGTIAVPVLSAAKGEILTVQNPTAANVNVTLYENDAGNTVLGVTIAAYTYQALYVPFFGRLWATSGAGVILSGHVIADN